MAGTNSWVRSRLATLALLALVFLLAACGRAADTSGLSGNWALCAARGDNITVPDSWIQDNYLRIRFDPDGTGLLSDGQTEGKIRWSFTEGVLSILSGTTKFTGYLKDNNILLSAENSDLLLVFEEKTATASENRPNTFQDNSEETLTVPVDSWYGWWNMEGSTGEMPDSWYDCCAVFQPEADGTLRMLVWDEDGSRDEPLADVVFTRGDDGMLVALNGYFLYEEIKKGDWILDVDSRTVFLSQLRHRAEGEDFVYSIYLRPWGVLWDDAPQEQLPFYYEDWYVPLISSDSPMPDCIPWQRLESERAQPVNDRAGTPDGR